MSDETIITILADSTESDSGLLPRLKALGVQLKVGDLEAGRYVLSGDMAVERFTANEFVEGIIDGRLFHRAGKLSMGFPRPVFLIDGDVYSTRAPIAREAIDGALSFLLCVEGASVLYVRNPTAAADLLYRLAKHVQKNQGFSTAFQRAKVSPGRQEALFTIESVVGVGPSTAVKALQNFRSIFAFVNASVQQLMGIPGIGQKKAERIFNSIRWEDDVHNPGLPDHSAKPSRTEAVE